MSRRPAIVFGAGGFIGTNLCRGLAAAGYPVRAFGRRRLFPQAAPEVEWIEGDFANRDAVRRALPRDGVVYHLIHGVLPHAVPAVDLDASLAPVFSMLDMCKAAGVARVVFVSSGGTVYGAAEQVPTPETSPLAPMTPYARANVAIEERMVRLHEQSGIETRVLRVTNPYGPYQTADKNQGVIAALISRTLRGERIEIWGDGSVVRDFVYIGDVVAALTLAASDAGASRILNIGSGQGRSLREVIAVVGAALGGAVMIDFKPGRPADVPVSVVAIERAREELGWAPKTDFAAGLKATVDWWRSRAREAN
jgi:UDP-glucose 4-epimerase